MARRQPVVLMDSIERTGALFSQVCTLIVDLEDLGFWLEAVATFEIDGSSNLVGACTGRSRGAAPRRMRSTLGGHRLAHLRNTLRSRPNTGCTMASRGRGLGCGEAHLSCPGRAPNRVASAIMPISRSGELMGFRIVLLPEVTSLIGPLCRPWRVRPMEWSSRAPSRS
jgi:hypothetical protein